MDYYGKLSFHTFRTLIKKDLILMKPILMFLWIVFFSFSVLMLSSCKDSTAPLKIGFANTLTGKGFDLGIELQKWSDAGCG
jgi:hypothetical protein